MKKILLFLFIHVGFLGYGQTKLDTSQLPMTQIRNSVGSSNWGLTGNSGTTAGTNFIGNTDSVDLVFKTNNTERAKISGGGMFSTTNDVLVNGITVGKGGIQQSGNTVVGYRSLWSNISGTDNNALGYQALTANTTGSNNTTIGYQVMSSNTIGYSNTGVGNRTLLANTAGQSNSAIGILSLLSNTIGNYNTGLGRSSGQFIKTGSKNTIIGYGNTYIKSAALDSSLNNTVVIGTYDEIRIYSDSTQRTGIGTTTPLAKLHVNGDAIITTTASGASTDSLMTINASGNVRKRTVSDVVLGSLLNAVPQGELTSPTTATTTQSYTVTVSPSIPTGTDFSRIELYFNGIRQRRGAGKDYTITSSTTTSITFNFFATVGEPVTTSDIFFVEIK